MTLSEQALYLRRFRFPGNLEASYLDWHYSNVRNVLRLAIVPVIAFALFSAVRDFLYLKVPLYAVSGNGAVIVLCLLLFALTFLSGFGRVWQPVTVPLIWIAMTIMLNSPVVTGIHTSDLMLLVQLYTLLIFLAAFRFHFIWSLLLNSSLIISAYWVLSVRMHASAQSLTMFGERSLLIVFALMISALVQERLSRTAFLANYLLDQERNDERQKRERTEGMLHVLGQAIGGIVHDLGNPLNVVQGSAQLLEQMLEEESDPATLKELAEMIEEGARMLEYQRLSLIEQTRILEGKPIPIERKPTSLRRMVEVGIRYQNPKFAYGKQVLMEGEDLQIDVDEPKMTSVFMNLIGNAMKYSDREIRVLWRTQADKVWIAVLDQGRKGRGISEAEAKALFVAFGRLEAHAQIEGTGLGLLSVRKILEAHGGEVYIEGHQQGDPSSSVFSTSQSAYPSHLCEGFLTAFVLVCPTSVS